MIPLITSIPPSISRFDSNGRQIGAEYQQMCIGSWRSAGFRPISVHSNNEEPPSGVPVLRVERDASAITGKPHVFLADMIACGIAEAKGGVFAIANADLIINESLGRHVATLEAETAIISQRVDIADPSQRSGQIWECGYDFFALHGREMVDIDDIGLVFGMPWWDHWLPILVRERGIRLIEAEPSVYHLQHDAKWPWDAWLSLGTTFHGAMQRIISDPALKELHALAVRPRSGSLVADFKREIAGRMPSRRTAHQRAFLSRLSAANIAYISSVMRG